MAIGGFMINLERCAICKRRYRAQGRAIFRADRGGIVCMKCDKESSDKPGMEPETVKIIKSIYELPIQEAKEIKINDKVLKEMISVLKIHREYRIEKPMRSWKYVE